MYPIPQWEPEKCLRKMKTKHSEMQMYVVPERDPDAREIGIRMHKGTSWTYRASELCS